jgi:hypothetical protein
MAKMRVEIADSWEKVEAAALAASTCIRTSEKNWGRAKETWDAYNGTNSVVYGVIWEAGKQVPTGYLRLLKISTGHSLRSTMMVDYINPISYLAPLLMATLCPDYTMVVKVYGCDDEAIAAKWPKITLSTAALERYPYANTTIGTSEFRVILI